MTVVAEAAITTEELTKRYDGLTAVDHLDLEVAEGEVFGLLGPNGAGKTTTILMLLGLTDPTEGTARVMGLDPTRRPLDVKRLVGYVPDNVGFYGDMTGRQNLDYTTRLNGVPALLAEQRIASLLEQVGLAGPADQQVRTYSRGMRQRLGIADALVKDPKILILDEPTIGIDPEGVRDVLELIGTLPKKRGVTVLLSSHLLYQVQAICDRVGIFVRGKLVARGPVRELAARFASSRHVVVELAVADWTAAGEALRAVPGITKIERDEDYWVVTAEREVRPDIARAFAERGVPLLHLRRRGEALDEIYGRYFEGEESADGGRA